LTVDVTDPLNRFLNQLNLHVNFVPPVGVSQTFPLTKIAPGRYQGEFSAEGIGAYYLTVFGAQEADALPSQVFGFGIPYTDEFTRTAANQALLTQIAELTHGRRLDLHAPPTDLFTVPADVKAYGRSLWPICALLFVIVLLADVAARKFLAPQ